MAATERLLIRALRRSERQRKEFGVEVREARLTAGVSQAELGRKIGMSATKICRIEAGVLASLSIRDATLLAAALGLDLHVRAYPAGPLLRDAGQRRRLAAVLGNAARPLTYQTEVGLPQRPDQPRDWRAWDGVIYGREERTAVEFEMRLRDGQAVERRLALKRRDDPTQRFLLLLADTRTNRRVLAEHPELFGDLPRLKRVRVLKALRAGEHPPTGLVLI